MVKWEEFDIGEQVILDKGYRTECTVEIVLQSPNNMFTRVKSSVSESEWDVMTNRLEKIEK